MNIPHKISDATRPFKCPRNNTNDTANALSTFVNFSANLTLEQILLISRSDEANSLDVKITAVQII